LIDSRKADTEYEFDISKHVNFSNREKQNMKKFQHYEKFQCFLEVSRLEEGQSFGDEALISNTQEQNV